MRLQEDPARSTFAAGATRHLGHQLIGPFSGSQITSGETEVSVDNTYQCQQRKMESLGDDLGANQQIDIVILD